MAVLQVFVPKMWALISIFFNQFVPESKWTDTQADSVKTKSSSHASQHHSGIKTKTSNRSKPTAKRSILKRETLQQLLLCSVVNAAGNTVHFSGCCRWAKKDTVLQVHFLWEVHFTGDGGENETLLPAVGQRELDLSVQATRTEKRRVQSVGSVGGHDHLKKGGGATCYWSTCDDKLWRYHDARCIKPHVKLRLLD